MLTDYASEIMDEVWALRYSFPSHKQAREEWERVRGDSPDALIPPNNREDSQDVIEVRILKTLTYIF